MLYYSYPSPLDPLCYKWERGPFPALRLTLSLSRAERGRGGQGGEGMFKPKLDIPENIGLFAASSSFGRAKESIIVKNVLNNLRVARVFSLP